MSNEELAKNIVDLLGGLDNIKNAENCSTRIRVNVRDGDLVNVDALKAIPDVLAVVADDEGADYFQIVLGPGKVRDVMDICVSEYGIREPKNSQGQVGEWEANKEAVKGKQNKNVVSRLHVIADIFSPMIPAFIASGICNGLGKIVGLLITNAILPDTMVVNVIYNIFVLIGNAFLSYLAIFTGVQAAKQFNVNTMLGGMIGAASLNSVVDTISKTIGWYNAESVNDSILATNAGGIIGVVIGVWILSKVEHWVHKHMPSVVDVSFTPLVSMVITMPLYILIVMPISGWLSGIIGSFLNLFVYSSNPFVSILSGYIIAALYLTLVMLGLHRAFTPIYALQISTMGGSTLFPVAAMAGAGQVGASIALWIKARRVGNDHLRQVITGALPAGFLGIGEPLIYGVTLPMGKPFITSSLGAGFGGAYVLFCHVMTSAYSPSGILALTHTFPEFMLNFLIGLIISYVAGAIITYIFVSDDEVRAA